MAGSANLMAVREHLGSVVPEDVEVRLTGPVVSIPNTEFVVLWLEAVCTPDWDTETVFPLMAMLGILVSSGRLVVYCHSNSTFPGHRYIQRLCSRNGVPLVDTLEDCGEVVRDRLREQYLEDSGGAVHSGNWVQKARAMGNSSITVGNTVLGDRRSRSAVFGLDP